VKVSLNERDKNMNNYDRNYNGERRAKLDSATSGFNTETESLLYGLGSLDLPRPATAAVPDLVCFSHLRWNFVYQRPQHLLSRAARERRVFVIEEPVYDHGSMHLDVQETEDGVFVVVPHLPEGLQSEIATDAVLRGMVDGFFAEREIHQYVLWYYTPMALSFSQHLKPLAIVYDCMDELSAFKGASPNLRARERQLFSCADLVFTGGQSLYEAKRNQHDAVYAFPSSIDRAHFSQGRTALTEPEDQKSIPYPRLGFFGVIDERFDIELLDKIAAAKPDWHFVILGPVVKIDQASLPQRENIHYLGSKSYKELPAYLSGWDVALLLFARNEATRFISPTKTPEYLAAGKPVVSTSIRDVVRPYGELGIVKVADEPDEFIGAIEEVLAADRDRSDWLERVDKLLGTMSWDDTWSRMSQLIENVTAQRRALIATEVQSKAKARAAGLATGGY
jgi:UDP-galactopyranose mutase